jgi:5-hydroxyisourate hydrolase-like protein (transthyretin family)
MRFSVRFVPLILLALLSVAIPLHAQAPAKATAKIPAGTVSGRITIKDKPAPGVVVGLRKILDGNSPEPFVKTTTDHDGVYRITNVAPGSYDVVPAAPAFVVGDALNMRSKNVIVAEDENVEDINFTLVRGGVITGKVTNADGRLMIQEQVYLYRIEATAQQPQRPMVVARTMQTDDRGVYRFFGLNAGRYKVASGRAEDNSTGYQSARIVYKQVFHPDVNEQDKANIVEVREGSEANDIDIRMGRPLQTFSASGRLVGDDGQPAPNVRFGLQRNVARRIELVQSSALTNSQGNFTVDGLAPGKYSVFLYPDPSRVLRAEASTFDVIDSDVTGITIRLTKGSTISGVVVLEHEDKKAWAKLLETKLRGYLMSGSGAMMFAESGAASSISPDGSFQLTGLSPGTFSLWLSGAAGGTPPKGYLISRIEHNGVMTPNGIEVKDGDQLTGVRVFVSYGTGTLRGVVTYDAGLLPEGARMFARLVRPAAPVKDVANTFVDSRGHFLIEGLPAGVYELSVTMFVPGSKLRPPSAKQQITVQDGVVSEVSLSLNLTPPPQP